jgi:transposase
VQSRRTVTRLISIYENKKGVSLLGCWAHARRKFTEALKEDKPGAEYALEQIGMLYRVETMASDQGMDQGQRAELRKRLAYPPFVPLKNGS